jgi:hypothetical protein
MPQPELSKEVSRPEEELERRCAPPELPREELGEETTGVEAEGALGAATGAAGWGAAGWGAAGWGAVGWGAFAGDPPALWVAGPDRETVCGDTCREDLAGTMLAPPASSIGGALLRRRGTAEPADST